MSDISEHSAQIAARFQSLIEAAPEEVAPVPGTAVADRSVSPRTGLPKRYRAQWDRPTDHEWVGTFGKVMRAVESGGIIALIGPRGTGKTRFSAEAMRNFAPESGSYTTAMGLFLRIRASFGKTGKESEDEIVREMSTAVLLILDEVQERGNSAWEDRILTHILDRRYGAELPTIVIANLTEEALVQCLGDSIVSRLSETGGVIEVNGPSHRIHPDLPLP